MRTKPKTCECPLELLAPERDKVYAFRPKGLRGHALLRDEETRCRSHDPPLPANVRLARDARISGSERVQALRLAARDRAYRWANAATPTALNFAIGAEGCVAIGERLLSQRLHSARRAGDPDRQSRDDRLEHDDADSDFHPIAPSERIEDAIALCLSPRAAASEDSHKAGDHRRRCLHRSGLHDPERRHDRRRARSSSREAW